MESAFVTFLKFAAFALAALCCSAFADAKKSGLGESVRKYKAVIGVYANEDFTEFMLFNEDSWKPETLTYSKEQILDILRATMKDKSVIYVCSPMADLFDGVPNSDAFEILFLKDIIEAGFERIVFETHSYTYDSAKDPLVAYWESYYGKRFRKAANAENDAGATEEEKDDDFDGEYSFYVPGDADAYYAKYRQVNWKMGRGEDPLEEKGYVSLKTLKELGDSGDDDAYLFYAKYLAGLEFYNGDLNVSEAVRVLEMLADKGNYHAAAALFFIYSVGDDILDYDDGGFSYYDKEYAPFFDDAKSEKYKGIIFGGYEKHLSDDLDSSVIGWLIDVAKRDKNFEFLKFCAEMSSCVSAWEAFIESSFSTEKVFKNVTCEVCVPVSVMYKIEKLGEIIEVEYPDFAYKCLKRLQEHPEIIYYEGSFGDPFWEDIFLVAHFYIHGVGTKKDPEKAFEMVAKCFFSPRLAENMLSSAYLAYAYENGFGVEQSERRAYYYWTRFYTNERADVYGSAAARFYNGFGFPQDKKLAADILEKALEKVSKGREEIIDALIKIYGGEFGESEKDYEKLYRYKEMQRNLDMAQVLENSEK